MINPLIFVMESGVYLDIRAIILQSSLSKVYDYIDVMVE